MAHKKIVFVMVEGPSDDTALGMLLDRIFKDSKVFVKVMHTDITAKFIKYPNQNIITMVNSVVKNYMDSNHFKKINFKEIIHLIDTDGTFIPDINVIEDKEAIEPVYSLTDIRTCNKSGIEDRNKRKSDSINRLINCDKIGSIPYRAFYMSGNLDHVLYNKQNSSDDDKEKNAYNFANYYKDKIPEFIDFIMNSDFSVVDDYKKSWDFIKQDLHSLERYTNLGLCFKEIS